MELYYTSTPPQKKNYEASMDSQLVILVPLSRLNTIIICAILLLPACLSVNLVSYLDVDTVNIRRIVCALLLNDNH